jgi:hypothetical protein
VAARQPDGFTSMGRIKNPRLFSQDFDIDPKKITNLGLLDPILNGDTRLFVDPVLLRSSKNPIIASQGLANFAEHFGSIIRLLANSKAKNDLAWRNAARIFKLDELPSLCLGFGGDTTRGRSVDQETQARILQTAKEIVDLGIKDPELFSLLGLLEPGVGPDTIGDMTAHAILPALIEITADAARQLEIKVKDAYIDGHEARLPHNRLADKPLLLVPLDILRDLPVASDWSDISRAAQQNRAIRDRVNKFIGNIWELKLKEQKDEIRASALASEDAFKTILDAVYQLSDDSYDFSADPEGHRVFRETLQTIADRFPLRIVQPRAKNHAELKKIVVQIVEHFKALVEKNGINYLLWDAGRPRKEKAAQRLFFAVADVYCKANNIDISPESDSGGGPVDFKFSLGYSGRFLVEIKLSTGKVVHGYTTQLKVYEEAENSFDSIFLILDVGRLIPKLNRILELKNARASNSERTPEIVVVDAKQKPSASKR